MSGAARERASAFAPASVGNVAIGFDILGFAIDTLGDRVTVSRSATAGVQVTAVRGVAADLPRDARDNTAGRALLALQEAVRPDFGFSVEIDKGIPLGSGLGGSAASAVGAVVAANALLPQPVSRLELLKFAMAGEAVASDCRANSRRMAASTAWAVDSSVQANIEGPAPEIEQPSAPASMAPRRTSWKPGMSAARCGSITTSSKEARIMSRSSV